MTSALAYPQSYRIDLLAAYRALAQRRRTQRKRAFVRTSAFTLTYLGFICVGVALAPMAPVIQWYAQQLGEQVRAISPAFARAHQEATVAAPVLHESLPSLVGTMPQNSDKPLVLTKRQDALEVAGKAQDLAAVSLREEERLKGVIMAIQAMPKKQAPVAAAKTSPKQAAASSSNRIIIPKIKVNMPIVTGEDGKRALLKGAWLIPGTSTFDRGGNSVLSCHRYLYTKGPLTCFNLDKLKTGDELIVQWNGTQYYYKVRNGKVVTPKEVSILNNSREAILTIFTCTPVFTSKNRLYFVADLVSTKPIVQAQMN